MSPLRWDMAQKSRTIICYSLVVEALVAFLTLHLDIKIHKCMRLPCAGTWPKRQELLTLFACRVKDHATLLHFTSLVDQDARDTITTWVDGYQTKQCYDS